MEWKLRMGSPAQRRVGPPAQPSERGQATVEWVGLVLLIGLLLAALAAAGVRVPGAALARAVASRLLCAAAIADSCGDEPALIAAYGSGVGRLVRESMPSLLLERGSEGLPVDYRRCRSTACGDGSRRGVVRRTDAGLPVTAFVRVVDCRPEGAAATAAEGADCSDERRGNLYIQYWLYYADSATMRGVPLLGRRGYHRDDWESVQLRVGPDGEVAQRASSHHGFTNRTGAPAWGSDAGLDRLTGLTEAVGARPRGGWGPQTDLLFVAGGSHAGSNATLLDFDRLVRGRTVHLVPLEPVAAEETTRFAVTPPWRKRVWNDPEHAGTD
jgi:hypothetical protein